MGVDSESKTRELEAARRLRETEGDDPRSEMYREALTEAPIIQRTIRAHNVALLCIDLQYFDAAEGYGILKDAPPEKIAYYFDRLERAVLPNTRRLQQAFRAAKLEVIHTRIQSLTRDGRDRSRGHKMLEIHAPPGSKAAQFLPEVAPVGDEIVFNKTASGVFASTNIDYVLRNLKIESLFICGVYTNECVDTAVRSACDEGYFVTLVADACAAMTPEQHYASIQSLRDRYARVQTTDETLAEVTYES